MLEFKNINVKFETTILENVSGHIAPKTITFLIGPNGSGKTTLLKSLARIQTLESGKITTEKNPIYLGANVLIQPGLTGHDLFDLYETQSSPWLDKNAILEFAVGDLLNRRLETLSSGERQRVLLLAVLFHPSPVVLLDEPLSFLDWNYSLKLKHIVDNMRANGRAFVISNHELGWSLRFNDTETWVLFQRAFALKGSTNLVLKDPKLRDIFNVTPQLVEHKGQTLFTF